MVNPLDYSGSYFFIHFFFDVGKVSFFLCGPTHKKNNYFVFFSPYWSSHWIIVFLQLPYYQKLYFSTSLYLIYCIFRTGLHLAMPLLHLERGRGVQPQRLFITDEPARGILGKKPFYRDNLIIDKLNRTPLPQKGDKMNQFL